MQHDFWHERWQNDQIGFHQPEGQPLLRAHWSSLELKPGARILVPLLGGLQAGSQGLLLAFEYPPGQIDGPPFSIEPDEVQALFGGGCDVTQMAERSGPPEMDHLRKHGLTHACDRLYRIVRR